MTAPRTLADVYKKQKGQPISLAEIYGTKPASAPETPDAYDSLPTQFVKSVGQGLSSIVTGPTELLAMAQKKMGLGDSITGFAERLRKNVDSEISLHEDPNGGFGQSLTQGVGELIGMAIPAAVTFGASEAAAGMAIARSTTASRALANISRVAESAFKSPLAGKIVAAAPKSLAGGIGGQALLDPESVTTKTGLGLAAGFGMVGAVFHGVRGVRQAAVKRGVKEIEYMAEVSGKKLDPAILVVSERIGSSAQEGKSVLQKAQGLEVKLSDERIGIKKAPWKDVENKADNPSVLATLMSGSFGRAKEFLLGKGSFLTDKNGEIRWTGKSLASTLSVIKDSADHVMFQASVLAKHTLDSGMLEKEVLRKQALSRTLAGYPEQDVVNSVYNFLNRSGSEVETLSSVLKHVGSSTKKSVSPDMVKEVMGISRSLLSESYMTGVSVEEAKAALAAIPKHIQKAADEYSQFSRNLLQYKVDAGLLTQEAADTFFKNYQNYMPLARIFEKAPKNVGYVQMKEWIGSQVGGSLKEMKGSKKMIQDPIRSMITETNQGIKAADFNRLIMSMYDFAVSQPKKNLITNLDNPLNVDHIFKILPDAADATTNPAVFAMRDQLILGAKEAGSVLNESEALQIAHSMVPNAVDERNVVSFFYEGVLKRARISEDIAVALKSFQPQEMNLFVKIMSAPARGLKAGVTASLDFAGFNFISDSFDATLQSKYGFKLFVDSFRGLKAARGAKGYENVRSEWIAGGGGFSGLRSAAEVSDAELYRAILPQTRAQLVKNNFKHPIEALRKITQPLEEAARLGEYMRARGANESVVGAALAARGVTTDFAIMGSQMHSLSQMTAFLNPAVQSLKRNIDVSIHNPMQVAAKGIAGISLPSAVIWALGHGDQDIEDLRKSKAGKIYWHIRMPNGEIGRIRKPFLYGQIFGTGMESVLDKLIDGDPNAGKQFIQGFTGQAGISFLPNTVSVGASLFANKDFHSGSPIVPTDLTGLDKEFQENEQTTHVARVLSRTLNKVSGGVINGSPIQWDYILRATTGTLGESAVKTLDRGIPSENSGPTKTHSDLPLIGRYFARFPSQSVQPVREFYDGLSKTEEVVKTVNYLSKNKPEELEQYITENQEALALAPVYTETKQQLADIRHTIKTINGAPDDILSPEEKKQFNDDFVKQIVDITRSVNRAIRPADQNPLLGSLR